MQACFHGLLEQLYLSRKIVSGHVVEGRTGALLAATSHRSRQEIQKYAVVVAEGAISIFIGGMAWFQEKGPEIRPSGDHRRSSARSQLAPTKVKRQPLGSAYDAM